jgi:gamma-glutamyltranspeptidase/glutathione hydrolase/leukotriene-C4 hydrolase
VAVAPGLLVLAGILLFLSSLGDAGASAGCRPEVGGAWLWSWQEVEQVVGAAAADNARCLEVGATAMWAPEHAVDVTVATALCLGVVDPMSSGVVGGVFVVVRHAATGEAVAFDVRETAPAAEPPGGHSRESATVVGGAGEGEGDGSRMVTPTRGPRRRARRRRVERRAQDWN